MAEKFRFFDSIDGTDERYYTADEFAEYFRHFVRNGIFNGGENLKISTDGINMKTYIKPGVAWLEGYLYKIDTENLVLEHSTSDPNMNRIDRIVIRLDKTLQNRYVKAFILEGVPAVTPLPKELTRNDNIYEISLAQINIIAGKSYIEASQLTDERLNNSVCGLVTHVFDQVDTTGIFDEFNAWLESRTSEPDGSFYREWKDWFDELQDTTNLVTKTQFEAHQAETTIRDGVGSNSISVQTGGNFQYTQYRKIAWKQASDCTNPATLNVDSKGAKSLKKIDGSQVSSLKASKVYEAYYDINGDCFFILARAEGNAADTDVLAGKTFSNEDASGLVGRRVFMVKNIESAVARAAASSVYWMSVCYGNGLFVGLSQYPGAVMTSPDGIVWTSRTIPQTYEWNSICFGNGLFVAVAQSGFNRIMTSPDGINWTLRTAPVGAYVWQSVCYGNGLFVAVAQSYNRCLTSPDGINWTERILPESNQWMGICYGNGLFVAVARSGTNRVMTSPDGINWTPRASSEANSWRSVCCGNGKFVAVSSDGTNRVMTSPDGLTWTARTAAEANPWYSVCFGDGIYLAVAQSGTNRIMISPDGVSWTAKTASEANSWLGVCYMNGLFVAVAGSGTNRVMTMNALGTLLVA